MNFLLHLRLADIAGLPPAGAIIGDVLRGRINPALPAPLAQSIALHRRVDALSDRHAVLAGLKAGFAADQRRYAGIVLDLLCDYVAANDWARYGRAGESLTDFAERMAAAVADVGAWQAAVGQAAPEARRFGRLLMSYRDAEGIDRAVARIAERLRQPQPFRDAAEAWRSQIDPTAKVLPTVFADLAEAAQHFSPG